MGNAVHRDRGGFLSTWIAFAGASLLAITLFAEETLAQPAKQGPTSSPGQPAPGSGAPSAEPPSPGFVRLSYTLGKGTAGCDGEVMFRRLVASETNQPDPFALKGAPTHELSIGIERDSPGFRTIVELRRADGAVVDHREYAERTCADAVDRAVISVMLAVFPGPERPGQGAPNGTGAPAAGSECVECVKRVGALEEEVQDLKGRIDRLTKTLASLESEPARDRRRRGAMDLAFALSTGALLTANLTSNVGPGVWLGADARIKYFSLGIEARVALPSPVFLEPSYTFDYSQVVGLLTPCLRISYFFGCAVGGGGAEIIRDSDYPSPDPDTHFFAMLQIGGRAGVEIPFGDAPIGARAWGEVLYTNPKLFFYYEDPVSVWRRQQVSAFFGVGLVIFLGDKEAT